MIDFDGLHRLLKVVSGSPFLPQKAMSHVLRHISPNPKIAVKLPQSIVTINSLSLRLSLVFCLLTTYGPVSEGEEKKHITTTLTLASTAEIIFLKCEM